MTDERDQFGAHPKSANSSPQDTPSLLAEMQRLIDEPSARNDEHDTPFEAPESMLREMLTSNSAIPDTPEGTPLQLGRFELLSVLGSGGFGIVFHAHDKMLDRRVALKTLRPEAAESPTLRQRFLREAKAAAQLEHPGIVPIHGLGADESGRPFFAMRLVHGESLAQAIERLHASTGGDRSLQLRKLLSRFVTVCQTIEYAHRRGVIHRDLKPANIMLGDFGETLVVDWGMAKRVGELSRENESAPSETSASLSSPHTREGTVFGTPAYMSPE